MTTSQGYIPNHTSLHHQTNQTTTKIKSKIVKTYHHDIRVTYEGLMSQTDLTLEDSDPDETQRFVNCMMSQQPNYRPTSSSTRNKHSISAMSTVDSGVVSHDSLLDHYRDSSASRSERSVSPMSRHSTPHRTPRRNSQSDFDPMNRINILDGNLRSKSRSRIEERGKSPCRGHGVKQMIQFFEGSQENISTTADSQDNTSTNKPEHKETNAKTTPRIASPLTPLRYAKLQNSRSCVNGSAVTSEGENVSPSTAHRSKQENVIHLTCVASGYSKYSPYNDGNSNKNTVTLIKSGNSDTPEQNISSNIQKNGALDGHLDENNQNSVMYTNGDMHVPPQHKNSGLNRTNSNNQTAATGSSDSGLNTDDIAIEINEQTTPKTLNGHLDEVDRSVITLSNLDNSKSITEEAAPKPKLNGVIKTNSSVEDSPSKKNGEWFLNITDNAQAKLLQLCEAAQSDLDSNDLSDEVCGQIRAAIGKAQLLINKKFKQFRGLCHKNLTQGPDEPFPTTSQDLAGFWDLVHIQVQGCETNFSDIDELKKNGWVVKCKADTSSNNEVKTPITPRNGNSITSEPKSRTKPASNKQTAAAKARDEARKRLMAAKKAMRERRNSESEDVIFVS